MMNFRLKIVFCIKTNVVEYFVIASSFKKILRATIMGCILSILK